ncbi:hypothetical protein ACQKKX_04540 [Neorhizobium sp. NPDC001467]|uniref:hypothetical protein n=1 Tax=Neorhizobium sp. NPDC001467 TaxID=3390595 RepID=UPI003CFF2132
MIPDPTLDAICAANSALLLRLETISQAEMSTQFPADLELVMTFGHDDEVWTLHIVPKNGARFHNAVVYHCGVPDNVFNVGDIAAYLTTPAWSETLIRMSQDYDAFHGPNPVKLD